MKRYHHGNLRAALIEAGLILIEEKGVRAFTLREIGTRAGVSRMAAYRHFADKADLLRAICEAGFARFGDALEEARQNAGEDFASQLGAMGLAYIRFAAEHHAYYEVMFGSQDQAIQASATADRAFRILEETIHQGQLTGEVREGDSVILAQLVWSMVHGVSTLHLAADLSEGRAGAKFMSFCTEVLLTGLASPRTGLPTPHSTLDSATQPTK